MQTRGSLPRPQSGVTLIEMLVVVGIIGLIAAVTAPSVASGLDAVRMASATESVATFLNAAVNHAQRRELPIELVFSFKENKLDMYSNEPGFSRELKLPDGVLLDAVLPKTEDDDQGVRRIILMPGAAAPGIGVQLANRRGSKRIVRLDPMTGFPRTEIVKSE
ncbi:MAG TPA: type II secretion system protein [Bryobacteraceae bacterium]|nr:type II secretion system protein [Bryobacteraceae bacterium]